MTFNIRPVYAYGPTGITPISNDVELKTFCSVAATSYWSGKYQINVGLEQNKYLPSVKTKYKSDLLQ